MLEATSRSPSPNSCTGTGALQYVLPPRGHHPSRSRSLIARHPRSVHDTVTNVDVTVLNLNGSEPSDGTGACAELETEETPDSKIYSITEAASSVPVTIANKSPTCFRSSLDACAPAQLY